MRKIPQVSLNSRTKRAVLKLENPHCYYRHFGPAFVASHKSSGAKRNNAECNGFVDFFFYTNITRATPFNIVSG